MSNMYVVITVRVSDNEYGFDGKGDAEARFQLPRSALEVLQPAALVQGLVLAALHNYDAAAEGEEE